MKEIQDKNQEIRAVKYKFLNFPQPPVAAFGTVSDAGVLGAASQPSVTLTTSKTGTGTYLVTHNLGTTNYYPQLTPIETTVRQITTSTKAENTFTVLTANGSGTLTDTAFDFIIFTNY